MPLHESRRKLRDRWPLAFDLDGVPRESAERQRLLVEHRNLATLEDSIMSSSARNSFLLDKLSPEQKADLLDSLLQQAPVGKEIDINNPPRQNYRHQEFPRLVYNHKTGSMLQVDDAAELKEAVKRGFKTEPAPNRDYSQVKGTVASIAGKVRRTKELSAEELADLDAEEAAAARK